MGNTISTPNQPDQHHGSTFSHSSRRPSQKPSSTRSLRKMTSSSTLSSLKMYRQNNRSETSLSSKMSSRSTSRATSNFGEKILDISKPTKFEHGIHVEYNRDSGKYMVWACKCVDGYRMIHPFVIGFTRCMAIQPSKRWCFRHALCYSSPCAFASKART